MNEIIKINLERLKDLREIESYQLNSSPQREKIREYRQNLLLKMLRTIKIFTHQYKIQIHHYVLTIMNQYNCENCDQFCVQQLQKSQNFQHYLMEMVNVLYTNFQNLMDCNKIKRIMRSNNNYIISDLVRAVIQFCRSHFQNKVQNLKYKPMQCRQKRQKFFTEQSIPQENNESLKNNNIFFTNTIIKIDPQQLQQAHYHKCMKFAETSDAQQLQIKLNQLFSQLNTLNGHNQQIIFKFRQFCFGKKHTLDYDYSGLYTQEQKSKMYNSVNQQLIEFNALKKRNEFNSEEELKQYAKIAREIKLKQQRNPKYEYSIVHTINQWVPLIVQISKNQITTVLELNFIKGQKEMIHWSKAKNITVFELIKQHIMSKTQSIKNLQGKSQVRRNSPIKKEQIALKKLYRNIFADFSRKKLLNSISENKVKSKKQATLPMLKLQQSKQIFNRKYYDKSTTNKISKQIQLNSKILKTETPETDMQMRQLILQKQYSIKF